MTVSGHQLTHNSSCTPQLMEDQAGDYRHGVIVKLADGNGLYFRQDMNPSAADKTSGADIDQLFDLSTIAGDPLVMPVQTWEDSPPDEHFGLAIGVDDQDRIWIAGNAHNDNGTDQHDGPLRMARCNVAGGSSTAGDWQAITYATSGMAGIAACGTNRGHTYHHFRRLSDGTLLWFLSQRDDAGSSRGRDFLCFYLDPGTDDWLPLITTTGADSNLAGTPTVAAAGHFAVARGTANATAPNLYVGPANRVYVNGVHVQVIDSITDRLHVWGLWRTQDSIGNSSQQPYYIYCDNPVGNDTGWKTITGVSQPMPITWDNRVASATVIGPGTCQQGAAVSLAIDGDGYPHMMMQNGGTGAPPFNADDTIPGYAESLHVTTGVAGTMHVYWDGSQWVKEGVPWRSHYGTNGSNIYYSPLSDDGYLLAPARLNEEPLRHLRAMPNWGQDSIDLPFVRFGFLNAGEVNPDPVTMTRSGVLAFVLSDEDTPRVYTFGASEPCLPAPARFQNTNPGP